MISPAYTVQNTFPIGTNVSLIAENSPPVLAADGSDYEFFLTDVTSGRIYAQDLIQSVLATGINVVFTIVYPSDEGLSKWGTIYTENPIVWGP